MSQLTRNAERRHLKRVEVVDLARQTPFLGWAMSGNFVADREPLDLMEWRYLRHIYEAVPMNPAGLDMVIMKSAQGGASIFALLWTLWLMLLRDRCQAAYFLPTAELAAKFSTNRFIRLVRENQAIHRLMGDPGSPHASHVVDEGSASIRRLLQSIVYFTHISGTVTTEALPLDALVFDEVQEMLLRDIEKAEERLSASSLQAILRVSTANFAGSDIHYFYERSDQREFYTRCNCPDGTILADAWDPRNGPLCIDRGNGSTPGVPRSFFYVCPRCKMIIKDVQDGEFRPRNPGPRRIGFHFPQLLSPRQTAEQILEKWERRVDNKNFFNRILGRPYSDPNTQPVSQAHLEAAQNRDLSWGPLPTRSTDGVFMGIDQMGHESYIVIKARIGGRMRLLHLEIIQDDDPWRRCAALMRDYHVRVAAVEQLPNFNEAHRFAKEYDSRVFLVDYGDIAEEMLLWGDRPRDTAATSRSSDEFRTPWTVKVDQYKMMSWSLSRWAEGDVDTPDARTLTQDVRGERGGSDVMVCRDVFWLHLQRVALVTEEPEGRANERRPRRAVKKIGIDPHFAFANMLCDVAWARAHGTTQMLFSDATPSALPAEKKLHPFMEQIREGYPEAFRDDDGLELTCGDCDHFDPERRRCELRNFDVQANLRECECFIPRPDDDDDDF